MRFFDHAIFQNISDHHPEPSVLGLSGSPRKNGNSDLLLKEVLKGAKQQGATSEGIYLRDVQFQPCIGCEKCRKDHICTGHKDGMSLLYPDIIASKGMVLVSPTHNYNITAWMKAFIDRLYCFYNFNPKRPSGWSSQLGNQGRKVVIVAVCEQDNKKDMGFTLDAMRLPMEALGYDIVGELPVFHIFDKAKVKESPKILAQASELGAELARSIS
ncbi:flavodoxin family protein [Desulfoluna sp.]|uniref:flavodoxin family protein n=1 Tax=Desulfoluna sp. TaxID=2045199 RepID=UPI00261E0508|nr:flavodoxin family protein [Desulfoluna sp.]